MSTTEMPTLPKAGLTARLRRSTFGTAAVEFALLLPVMVLIFVAAVDLLRAMTVARRTTNAVDTMAQIVSQTHRSTILDSDIVLAINSIPTTFPDVLGDAVREGRSAWTDDIKVTISSASFTGTPNTSQGAQNNCTPVALTNPVTVACTGATAVIGWSVSNFTNNYRACTTTNSTNSTTPDMTTLPANLYYGTASFIVVDLSYTFNPLFPKLSSVFPGPFAFHRVAYLPPRFYKQLTFTPGNGSVSSTSATCTQQSVSDPVDGYTLTGCTCS